MSAETLTPACREIVALCKEAENWLTDDRNADRVGREKASLRRSVRRLSIQAARLEAASQRPMNVAVFGPSQVGKSYLVSVVASPGEGALRASFDGHDPIDFLSQINPAGEKESTGLVTRFTTRKLAAPPPQGFPVTLNLLSECDIIKVIGNTYFNDGDQTKEEVPSPDDLASTVEVLRARPQQASGLSEDDMLDLQDYFQKHFVGTRLIEILSNYWHHIIELGPVLDRQGRATLFAFLWGRHAKFTALYGQLVDAIERLGRSAEAFAGIDALIPREQSIIDVATLEGIGEADGPRVTLCTRTGRSLSLPRALATALTAELRIEMAEQPRDMFRHTDLLDFPGARSRQKFSLANQLDEQKFGLRDCFLRGKVAYLFDRYVADQDLTAMMLCVRPSNNEVVTLPDMIDEWIADTHGRTVEARRNKPVSLFFVLTWFDTHFVDKVGDLTSPSGRFKARLDASLLGFFGKAHTWPREWTPGRPFNNCYWFRNPNYPAPSIISYQGKREIELLPEKMTRIQELEDGFLSIEEAEQHFRDPKRAFREGLRLNDGGASYIVESLEPICRPELKAEQIRARLDDIKHDLVALLSRFYVSLDVEGRLDERRQAANAVFDALERAMARGTFATLLRHFMVDPTELSEEIYATLRAGFGDTAKVAGVLGKTGATLVRPGQRPSPPPNAGAGPRAGTAEILLAQRAMESFIARLRRTTDSEVTARTVGVPRAEMQEIADELIALAGRIGLQDRLADLFKKHLGTPKPEPESAARIALIASVEINRLVGDFGFGSQPDMAKPAIELGDTTRTAFGSRPIRFDAKALKQEPEPFAVNYVNDWFSGFYKVVEDNAKNLAGIQVDLTQNTRLKTILDSLRGAGP